METSHLWYSKEVIKNALTSESARAITQYPLQNVTDWLVDLMNVLYMTKRSQCIGNNYEVHKQNSEFPSELYLYPVFLTFPKLVYFQRLIYLFCFIGLGRWQSEQLFIILRWFCWSDAKLVHLYQTLSPTFMDE